MHGKWQVNTHLATVPEFTQPTDTGCEWPQGCDFFSMSLFLLNSDGDRVRLLHSRGPSWKRKSGIPLLQAPLLALKRALLAVSQPPYLVLLQLSGDRHVLGGVDEKPAASLSSSLTKATLQHC